jgi:hypothetical protein
VDFFSLPGFRLINPYVFVVMVVCVDDSQGIMLVEYFLAEVERG